ncbi:MAG TPA: hypothetical protein VF171_07590, partial [Trueperaceae bacterium]
WDGFAYWAQGESVRRRALAAAGTPGEAENVLWSASPIERAAGMQAQGDLYLLWYGPTPGVVGADFALFLADTRTPFVPGWRDHLAARLGWNPWTFWQALGGQVLGSLFVSVAAALLSLPLFWLLGLLFGGRGAGQGVLLSVGVVVILCVLMYARSRTLPAGPWQLALSLLVAGAVAYPLTRRANTEVQTQTLLGALLTTFVAVSLLGFLNLQHWVGMWSALGG